MVWNSLYDIKNLTNWGIPTPNALNNQGQARGLLFKWSELEKEFRGLNPAPDPSDDLFYVVCDVLQIDQPIILRDTLYIFARRIELSGNGAVDAQADFSNLTIITQEIVKNNKNISLPVKTSSGKTLELTPYGNRAATIITCTPPTKLSIDVWSGSQPIVSGFADNLEAGEPLRLGMVASFQLASLLSASKNAELDKALASINLTTLDLAMRQLDWIAAITDVNAETRAIAGQARSQLGWLIKQKQGQMVVPPLDFSIYRDSAQAWIDILRSLSATYDKWVEMDVNNKNWLTQAKLAVGLQEDEAQLQTKLEQRAESKLKITRGAESEGAAQLKALQDALYVAHNNFEAGVSIWKRHNEISAAFKLLADIVKFGIAIGKLIAMVAVPGAGEAGAATGAEAGAEAGAGEGAAEGAADGASDAAKGVSGQFGKVKEALGPLGEAAGAGMAIADDAKKIIDIGKTADAMNNMAEDTLKKVNESLNQTLTISPLSGLNTVTGGKQIWETLKVGMDDIFNTPKTEGLLNEIDGGPDFRVAFRKLIVGAEAYCSARLAVAEACNSLAEAKLRSKSADRGLNLAKNSQQEFQDNQALYTQLKQEAFNRILDAKRTVYFSLEQYQQAAQYYTLTKDLQPLPNITDSVQQYINEGARISGLELILDELSPKPQVLNPMPIAIPISDENRSKNSIVVQIDAQNPTFRPYARVRIDKIEIELKDRNQSAILVPEIHIGTSGLYQDIVPNNGGTMQFSGNPFKRTITYDLQGKVVMDSNVYARFKDVVFKPTPFTTWTLQLPDEATVNKVSSIILTITGAVSSAS